MQICAVGTTVTFLLRLCTYRHSQGHEEVLKTERSPRRSRSALQYQGCLMTAKAEFKSVPHLVNCTPSSTNWTRTRVPLVTCLFCNAFPYTAWEWPQTQYLKECFIHVKSKHESVTLPVMKKKKQVYGSSAEMCRIHVKLCIDFCIL